MLCYIVGFVAGIVLFVIAMGLLCYLVGFAGVLCSCVVNSVAFSFSFM